MCMKGCEFPRPHATPGYLLAYSCTLPVNGVRIFVHFEEHIFRPSMIARKYDVFRRISYGTRKQ